MPKFSKPHDCQKCPNKSEYLKTFTNADMGKIENNCIVVNFKKGENICKQGSQVTHVLYLARGLVKLFIEGHNKNIILKFIKSGTYIGLHSPFSDKIFRYSVASIENSTVCMIDIKCFMQLAKANNDYLFQITKHISENTNYVFQRIIDLNQKQLRGRIADSLLYFADNLYNDSKFELALTRRELAEFSSMSMENAVRVLSELKKDGIIKISGKTIEIKHREILEKLSEIG